MRRISGKDGTLDFGSPAADMLREMYSEPAVDPNWAMKVKSRTPPRVRREPTERELVALRKWIGLPEHAPET
jgi:hypothetical protein